MQFWVIQIIYLPIQNINIGKFRQIYTLLCYIVLNRQIFSAASTMSNLTVKEQYVRVAYLGVSFMIMFTSFNSLQNIVGKLYDQYGYNNLGQTALLFIYGAFGINVLFSSFIVKKLGYKKAMFFASLGYGIFEATGFLVVTDVDIDHTIVWVVIIFGAIICGVSASTLWVAQGAYVSQVADTNRKGELFGLFWGLMMSSQIIGNLLIVFVLGKLSNLTYFILLTILGFLSSILFLFLPNVSKTGQSEKEAQASVKVEIKKICAIVTNKKYAFLNMYFIFPGITVAFYAGFLYKLVLSSIPHDEGQSKADYEHRLNFNDGLVMITLGLSQAATGLLMNRFSQRFCKFKLAIVATLIVEVASFVSLVCFYSKSFPLSFVVGGLWGSAETFLQTNNGSLIGQIFPGKVEGFSVYRIFFSIGSVTGFLLGIALSGTPGYIFLSIVAAIQVIITGISINLKDLDTKNEQRQNSLISEQESPPTTE